VALVKESHKCVNQFGHDTGAFLCRPEEGLWNVGWGLLVRELTQDYQAAWASWCVVYGSGDSERQRDFKFLDRIRFPVRVEHDCRSQANTWGSGTCKAVSQAAAHEQNVLQELESCADLGVATLQIDDGWQGSEYESWTPHPEAYPDGWGPLRERASELGVELGLWASSMQISEEDLVRNNTEGGFVAYKLDFTVLRNRTDISALMDKVRSFLKRSPHPVRVNWDVTEVHPRFGYFFGREYGQIYLENRKPMFGKQTVYCPHTVLKDLWELSHYVNLQKFQGSTQNRDMVDRLLSDAHCHGHDYCVAIPLFSSPLFFAQTRFFDDDARKVIRPLLALHRRHREAICQTIVYPIGDKPSNGSWTGFQAHNHETGNGFLLVFRELVNAEKEAVLRLRHLADEAYDIEDLYPRYACSPAEIRDGSLKIGIEQHPGFRFLAYRRRAAT